MNRLPWLDPFDDSQPFPNPEYALDEPDGLLAAGGSLTPRRLLRAYRNGIFPWYSSGQPILWWSPDPRTVLFTERSRISRSLRKTISKRVFSVTFDQAFIPVLQQCSEPRPNQPPGTWINPAMRAAYHRLHELGYAHSVETWHQGQLAGGLYGVAVGRVFYGESMFSRMSDASKIALVALCQQLQRWGFPFIDCQLPTTHLASMGAENIPRALFLELLRRCCAAPGPKGPWLFDADLPLAARAS